MKTTNKFRHITGLCSWESSRAVGSRVVQLPAESFIGRVLCGDHQTRISGFLVREKEGGKNDDAELIK